MALTKISTPELFDFSATNTALQLPTGPTTGTGGRPATPSTGEWRFNTTLKYVEFWDSTAWRQIDTEALVPPLIAAENFNTNTYFGNGGTQEIDAKFNEAANFNGSSSIIDVNGGSFNLSTMSVSSWINISNISQNYQVIFNNYSQTGSANRGWYVRYETGGNIRLRAFSDGNVEVANILQSTTINAGTWYNLAVTITSSQIKIYKNGSLINTTNISAAIGYSGTGGLPSIGVYRYAATSYGNYFNGKIDQVRIFNTALTLAQAEDCFTDETTTTAATLNFPAGAGCIAAYQLDGNGNDISGTYNGTTTDIGYTGFQFAPDFVWIKCMTTGFSSALYDTVRGATYRLVSNTSDPSNSPTTNGLTVFNTNGFTLGGSNTSSNRAGDEYVAWCWKAGGAASDITSSSSSVSVSKRSANAAAGFSIVTYTIDAITQVVLPHGLDSTPKLAIVKKVDSTGSWLVYNTFVSGKGRGFLNTEGVFDNSSMPTIDSTNITFLAQDPFDINNEAVIYFFADIPGYQKIGSYEGTGGALTVYTTDDGSSTGANGFQPSFVMIKRIDGGNGNWVIIDELRGSGDNRLYANLANGEDAGQGESFISNGFKPRQSSTNDTNIDGSFYLYLAIK